MCTTTMPSTGTTLSLIDSLLTPEIKKDVLEETGNRLFYNNSEHERRKCDADEARMMAVARLLNNLLKRATLAFVQRRMIEFDANPADNGCQKRAYAFSLLCESKELRKEVINLQDLAKTINQEIQKRKVAASSPSVFFNTLFKNVSLSKEMDFLLKCYVLKLTIKQDPPQENGIIDEKTDVNNLRLLSKRINNQLSGDSREKLVGNMAADIAKFSTKMLQDRVVNQLTLTMYEKQNLFFKEYKDHKPKCISCNFFDINVLLDHIRKEKSIIAIKSTKPEGKEIFYLFLDGGKKFQLIDEKELDTETPIILFEGAIAGHNNKMLEEKIKEHGFEKILLACAAIDTPFGSQSTLEDIKLEHAKQIIEQHRKVAAELGLDQKEPFLLLYHVYFNYLDKEMPKSRKK